MRIFEPVAILGMFMAVGLTGCGGEESGTSDAGKPGSYSSSSSSSSASSSSSTSSSTSSSSSSSGEVVILRPLDHVTGLMPYSYGKRWGHNNSNYGEAEGGVPFNTVYAAIDAGSDPSSTSGDPSWIYVDFPSPADQFYTGGETVDRSSLVYREEQRALNGGYEGRIRHSSRTARTGKFVYEIPLAADKAAVEVHVVPFQDEPYTDMIFSLKVESRDEITTTFKRSNSDPLLPQIQGFTFLDVEVTDGNLTLAFDLPTDYFGVSTIFVSDYKGPFLTCTDEGACE